MLQDSVVLSPAPGAEEDRTMCATAQDASLLVKPAPSPSQPQSPLPAKAGAGSACGSVRLSVAAVHSPAVDGSSTVSSSPSSNCCISTAALSTASPPALPACALSDCAETNPQQQQQQQGRGHRDQGAPAAAAAVRLTTPFAAAAAAAAAAAEGAPSGVQAATTAFAADFDTEAAPADIAAPAAAEEPETRPGAGVGGSQQQPASGQLAPCILKELGVSGSSLLRLLTGDCAVESQQPVWMVVNLQGKIKGSYTASKMFEFSVRGTLSNAQLVLGIDKDLPYTARQDLGFYRRLDAVLTAVHTGATYLPLTHASVEALSLNSTAATGWQPLVAPAACTLSAASTSSEVPASPAGSTGTDSAQHAAAVAADTHLQLALERLCGYSAATLAAAAATASQSDSSQAPQSAAGSPALSRASSASASCQGLPVLRGGDQNGGSSSNVAAAPAAAAAAAAAVEVGSSSSSGSKEPAWLYINHLGWCRGPFSGEKMVQAHLCGRLPRDTLVVCLNPELPPSLLCMDVAYYFRPFGVLLDNVANGWRYRPVDWQDVTGRGIIKGMQQQQSMQPSLQQQQLQQLSIAATPQPWSPLVWDETTDTPPPALLSPELLQPPKHVPTVHSQPGGQEGANSSTTCIKMPRRRRTKQPLTQPQPQPQQQQQQRHFGPAGGRSVLTHYRQAPSPVLVHAHGGFRGHNNGSGAPDWTTIQQQQQQQHQGAVLLAAGGGSSSNSGSQQLQAQVELQHHMMLLQLQDHPHHHQQQFVGAAGLPAGALSAHAQASMLHMSAPAALPLQQQQQQLTNTWVLQQPTDSVMYHADSGSAQQQTHQLYQQQLLAQQGSSQLTSQLSSASYGSRSPDPYTDGQGMSTVLASDANGGMNTAMHGMHGGMNSSGLVSLSAGMNAVGLESLLQPMQVLPAVPGPPTSDALLLQLLTQQQQQQYGLHGQMHASLGMNSPVPTCMGLAMQQQQQILMQLQQQQQPGVSGLAGGGIQGWAQ